MKPPLAPIQAPARKPTPHGTRCFEIDAERFKCPRAIHGELVRVFAFRRTSRQPSLCHEAVVERDARCARHVVVTRPRGAQSTRSVRHEFIARAAGEDAQSFEDAGDIWPLQTVITMLALSDDLDEL